VPDLDEVAVIDQGGGGAGLAVHHGAVLGAEVLDEPAIATSRQAHVAGGHPGVGQPQIEAPGAVLDAALVPPLAAAPDGDLVEGGEGEADRGEERPVALELQVEVGRGGERRRAEVHVREGAVGLGHARPPG
jgi:hypothetical protein